MNPIFVWIIVFTVCISSVAIYYVSKPVVNKVLAVSNATIYNFSANRTSWDNTLTIVSILADVWPIPVVIAFVAWGLLSSSRTEAISRYD